MSYLWVFYWKLHGQDPYSFLFKFVPDPSLRLWRKNNTAAYATLYQEKCCMGFSYLEYVLLGDMKIIVRGKFIFPKQCDQEKCNLHKCVLLSQIKNIEKVMFKFLFWEFFHLFVLFEFPKAQQLI